MNFYIICFYFFFGVAMKKNNHFGISLVVEFVWSTSAITE
jgi:hypothetical protein